MYRDGTDWVPDANGSDGGAAVGPRNVVSRDNKGLRHSIGNSSVACRVAIGWTKEKGGFWAEAQSDAYDLIRHVCQLVDRIVGKTKPIISEVFKNIPEKFRIRGRGFVQNEIHSQATKAGSWHATVTKKFYRPVRIRKKCCARPAITHSSGLAS